MTQGNADLTMNDLPVFSAELHPYRSLGRNGHRIFFIIAGALSIAHMAVFMISGAWPVVLFFGLDFLVLFGAFWLNNRAAKAREVVSLSRTNISIRKISPSGRETEHAFNPLWARFLVSRKAKIGITAMHVRGNGRETDVGTFLPLDDRERFASAFSGALARVKRGY
ncbi:DUF2244 domain-containing protein [Shinella sp. 838]|jgi:uncharacterized membrane protein|uniref:DUF2244 domain-containing protein n=1 Tax=unclassified Shinella TaxID=2643062 RepID=UPI0003C53310|nr:MULTISPECIES: DUF2244 domain-containing protein [unclassified Shinella]EYR80360.1 putative integral membrane protein [Shinella sp. DD12]MCA0341911.1 DUF2244 domain-containing protein [Pseudomonadota bacterium]MDG4671790.1 DUF2244 domain-containing protein [Shinella sp. 838]